MTARDVILVGGGAGGWHLGRDFGCHVSLLGFEWNITARTVLGGAVLD